MFFKPAGQDKIEAGEEAYAETVYRDPSGKTGRIKRILEKHPEAVNEAAGPRPKKDHGQSPLQVAFKTGRLEIAEVLMDHGADVNFMEAPVLFDAISCAIDSLCYKAFEISENAIPRLERMLQEGADVNRKASHGTSAIGWTVWRAKYIIESPTVYQDSQEMVRKQAARILDLLIRYGADFNAWAGDRELSSRTNRDFYRLDDYSPRAADDTSHRIDLRIFPQEYIRSRNLQI